MKFQVGLTGGIASGKTAVSDFFAELGITVIDADLISREVVKPGTEALQKITEHFGSSILNKNATLNRSLLRSIVFEDESERLWLNNLLHPIIRQQMLQERQSAKSAYVINVIPLLIESNQTSSFDRILVIDTPKEIQIQRLIERDNISKKEALAILSSQATREQRLAVADDILENAQGLQSLKQNVIKLNNNYLKLANKKAKNGSSSN